MGDFLEKLFSEQKSHSSESNTRIPFNPNKCDNMNGETLPTNLPLQRILITEFWIFWHSALSLRPDCKKKNNEKSQ